MDGMDKIFLKVSSLINILPHQSNLGISSSGVHITFSVSVKQELNYRAKEDGLSFH